MTFATKTVLVLLIAAIAAGCTGTPAAANPTPTTEVRQLPLATPTPTPAPTLAPTPDPTPSVAPTPACGDATEEAVVADMVSGPSLPLTKADFATAWNKRFGKAEAALKLDSWAVLQESGNVRSVQAAISETGTEDSMWALENSAGEMASIALVMLPSQGTMSQPLRTGRLLQTMLNIFSQDPAVLRELGVTLPLSGGEGLAGANACAYFAYGVSFWVRLVQVTNGGRGTFLYIRHATEAEKQRAESPASSSPRPPYAYPPLAQSTFAKFAPPLEAVPDVTGTKNGWITPVPSSVLRLTNTAWSGTFLGTIVPVPGGGTVYRFPDATGSPLYRLDSPFNAAQLASGRDVLTFVGADIGVTLPPGPRLMALLPYIVNTPTGEGLFFVDGQRIACSWVGGTIEAPKVGLSRDSVSQLCSVFAP